MMILQRWKIGKPGLSLAWKLCQHMIESKNRYGWMANPNIPLCDLDSLNWVSHRVPSSPASLHDTVQSTIPCVRRVDTHTFTYMCVEIVEDEDVTCEPSSPNETTAENGHVDPTKS